MANPFSIRATGDTILAADHNEVDAFFESYTAHGIINYSHKGAAIVAAGTLALGADGNVVHVTGATGITAISNPAPSNGTQIVLIFDSTPTLTHSANLLLANAANFTAAANDVLVLVYDGSSVWREVARKSISTPIDHGALGGLADDDHTQYATNVEFDDHNARHEPGGADPMAVDAAQATGSLRTISTDTPAAVGTAAPGSGLNASADDHVHAMPSAPTFSDFTNANHDHGDTDDGGSIIAATIAVAGSMAAADKQALTRQSVTGGTVTVDFSAGLTYELTTNANAAFTLTNPVSGAWHAVVIHYGGTHTVTWTTTVQWPGGTTPTWTSVNAKTDIVALYYSGTTWYGDASLNFTT